MIYEYQVNNNKKIIIHSYNKYLKFKIDKFIS